jgi:alpha-2-macroglobulin
MGRVASNHANAQVERLDERYGRAWRSDITAAWLAAAYQNMRQATLANELARGVAFADPRRPWPLDQSGSAGGIVYTAALHDAQLAFLLARHFPQRLRAEGPAALAALTAGNRGHNTASAAWTVLALDAWAAAAEAAPDAAFGIEEQLAGDRRRALAAAGTLVRRAAFSGEATALHFSAPRGTRAFYTATLAGYDRDPPATELRQGLEITRDYLDAAGQPTNSVRQGDELTVRVRFRSLAKREFWDGVVVDVLPGGFEPLLDGPKADAALSDTSTSTGTRSGGSGAATPAAASPWRPDYVDLREDRVVAFGAIGLQTREFRYRIRATTAGRFVVPPAYAESMYDPAAQARSLGGQVTVEAR